MVVSSSVIRDSGPKYAMSPGRRMQSVLSAEGKRLAVRGRLVIGDSGKNDRGLTRNAPSFKHVFPFKKSRSSSTLHMPSCSGCIRDRVVQFSAVLPRGPSISFSLWVLHDLPLHCWCLVI